MSYGCGVNDAHDAALAPPFGRLLTGDFPRQFDSQIKQ